ncbi:hypothetical protein EG329_000185 [Mollisiaceae sp. DMI_Dod_QoI]|nr:hypothetical protein EG329_000185 [Helotiales sp. DMI_Dod_QoI]
MAEDDSLDPVLDYDLDDLTTIPDINLSCASFNPYFDDTIFEQLSEVHDHQELPSHDQTVGLDGIQTFRHSKAGTSYSRTDKLRDHLRKKHGMYDVGEDSFDWVYDIGFDNNWSQECGFCGRSFDDWDSRASHIGDHFKDGADIAAWTVPYQKAPGPKSTSSSSESSSDSEGDNDDDNEDGDEGNGDLVDKDDGEDDDEDKDEDGGGDEDEDGYDDDYHGATIQQPGYHYYRGTVTGFAETLHSLSRYLRSDEQHERLLLGIGRRPMNVIIGGHKNTAPATSPRKNDTPMQDEDPALSIFEKTSKGKPIEDRDELQHQALSRGSSTARRETGGLAPLGRSKATNGAITRRVLDNVLNPEQLYTLCHKPTQPTIFMRQQSHNKSISSHEKQTKRQAMSSEALTASSSTSTDSTATQSQSLVSRYSSRASTADSRNVVPWHVQVPINNHVIQLVAEGSDERLWTLPCEFVFDGCNVRFPPNRYADWFAHSVSHFLGKLPRKAICRFCDGEDGIFEARDSLISSWADRMYHISLHWETGLSIENMRPDYWLIDHLWTSGLLDAETYEHAIRHSERPKCTGLVPFGHETDEMIQKREKGLQECYDLVKEARQFRIQDRKGKSPEASQPSRTLQATGNTHFIEIGSELVSSRAMPSKESTMTINNNNSRVLQISNEKNVDEDQNDKPAANTGCSRRRNTHILGDEHQPSCGDCSLKSEEMDDLTLLNSISSASEQSLACSGDVSTASSDKRTRLISGISDLTSPSVSALLETSRKSLPRRQKQSYWHSSSPIVVNSYQVDDRKAEASWNCAEQAPGIASVISGSNHKINRLDSSYQSIESKSAIIVERHRVPDDDRHYVTTTSRNGVQVHDHAARRYDAQEPRASEARFEDYKRTQEYYSDRKR